MSLSNRLRRNFKWLSAGVGLPVIFLICPPEWLGWTLFVFGQLIAVIDEWLNPRPRSHTGPLLPWNQMDAGDRLEYFFLPMSITVVGVLIVVITTGADVESWPPIVFGTLWIAFGLGLGYFNWRNRWGAVEAD